MEGSLDLSLAVLPHVKPPLLDPGYRAEACQVLGGLCQRTRPPSRLSRGRGWLEGQGDLGKEPAGSSE